MGSYNPQFIFFETQFLAHVDQQTLAAGALVGWLFATFAVILFGTLSSVNVLISHKHGAKDDRGIILVLRDGLMLAVIFAIPASILFWNIAPIFIMFGQEPAVVSLAESYLHALVWGLVPNFVIIPILGFLIGLGHTRVIMLFSILSVCTTILISYVLIFGEFGFPRLSIAGAGWGMTISYWITLITISAYLLVNNHFKKYFYHIFNLNKPSYLWELLRVGVPMGIMHFFEVGFFFTLTLVMGSISAKLLAVNQIVLQFLGALMSVIFSIAQAITVRMGHLLGAKEVSAAWRVCYLGVLISVILMSLLAICLWFFPTILISVDFDIHNPKNFEIIQNIKNLFMVSAIFQIFEAIRISLFGALRALKDTQFTLLTSIISFWCVALPCGYWLATFFRLGGPGLWWGMVVGVIFSVNLLLWRFNFKMNRMYVYSLLQPNAEF